MREEATKTYQQLSDEEKLPFIQKEQEEIAHKDRIVHDDLKNTIDKLTRAEHFLPNVIIFLERLQEVLNQYLSKSTGVPNLQPIFNRIDIFLTENDQIYLNEIESFACGKLMGHSNITCQKNFEPLLPRSSAALSIPQLFVFPSGGGVRGSSDELFEHIVKEVYNKFTIKFINAIIRRCLLFKI